MNNELLQELGLNEAQAKVYLTLIEKGELSPPKVAELTGESRTNAYMVLEKLEELGLVELTEEGSKKTYRPNNPVALENLVNRRKSELSNTESQIKGAMPQMLSYFYSFTEKPGVRLLEGADGLKEVYGDILRAKEDVYVLRASGRSESKTLSSEYFAKYKKRRAELGIRTTLFAQDIPSAREKPASDKDNLIERHWVKPEVYGEPMEIDVYGDRVALFMFGEDIMSVVINSPVAARAIKSLLDQLRT